MATKLAIMCFANPQQPLMVTVYASLYKFLILALVTFFTDVNKVHY